MKYGNLDNFEKIKSSDHDYYNKNGNGNGKTKRKNIKIWVLHKPGLELKANYG